MAITATDISVALNGDIRWTGTGNTTYTVLELHRFLQDLADDASASGNDLVDITSDTPSDRSTDNIITLLGNYNIDDTLAEHLYGGSITQSSGATVYSGLRVLGAVNAADTQLMVIQDNALYQFTTTPSSPYWGPQNGQIGGIGWNADVAAGVLMRILVKSRVNDVDIDGKRIRVQAREWGDTYDFFNVTLGQGESVAAIGTTPDAQNDSVQGTVTSYSDVLNSGGTANDPTGGFQKIDLNNGNGLIPYYSAWTSATDPKLKRLWEYTKDMTSRGTTKTVDTLNGEFFLGITHQIPYDQETGTFTERETVAWGTRVRYDTLVSGPFTPNNYVLFSPSGAAGRVLYDDGSNLLLVQIEDTSVNVADLDTITEYSGVIMGATSTTARANTTIAAVQDNDKNGGYGLLLALQDGGADGNTWIQLLGGSAPVDNLQIRGVTSGATANTNGTPSAKTIPKIFTGSYTGSYITAYGVGINGNDVGATDTLTPLIGASQTPPNNVTFTITGLVSGEDRILVGPSSGGVLDKDQLATENSTTTQNNVSTSVILNVAIPSDTPKTNGTIRVRDDVGVYTRQEYTSYTGNTFTLTGTFRGSNNGADVHYDAAPLANVFISYIDKLADASNISFTSVYLSDRPLFIRVRDGGGTPIKTFEGTGTLGSAGGSVAAIRTTDA